LFTNVFAFYKKIQSEIAELKRLIQQSNISEIKKLIQELKNLQSHPPKLDLQPMKILFGEIRSELNNLKKDFEKSTKNQQKLNEFISNHTDSKLSHFEGILKENVKDIQKSQNSQHESHTTSLGQFKIDLSKSLYDLIANNNVEKIFAPISASLEKKLLVAIDQLGQKLMNRIDQIDNKTDSQVKDVKYLLTELEKDFKERRKERKVQDDFINSCKTNSWKHFDQCPLELIRSWPTDQSSVPTIEALMKGGDLQFHSTTDISKIDSGLSFQEPGGKLLIHGREFDSRNVIRGGYGTVYFVKQHAIKVVEIVDHPQPLSGHVSKSEWLAELAYTRLV